MLVPYDALLSLPQATLQAMIKEYLLSQLEDGSFSDVDEQQLTQATERCKLALKKGELVVEYSEDDESIAIRQREHISAKAYDQSA
ncbi:MULTISPECIES: YheU family protein [Shewanella]|uniref:YheU family protein n=1 Tax=Shewanella metallivivens TaxID=2872342 RepID=A0ABT5TMN2_9GAMM|nr:YheU family protein [Shewanella metallivivens]MDD8059747.1 YheU family protein [Shewanella metallivivens]